MCSFLLFVFGLRLVAFFGFVFKKATIDKCISVQISVFRRNLKTLNSTGTVFSPAEMDLNTTWSPGVLFSENSFLTVWFSNYEPTTFTEVKESEVSIT